MKLPQKEKWKIDVIILSVFLLAQVQFAIIPPTAEFNELNRTMSSFVNVCQGRLQD